VLLILLYVSAYYYICVRILHICPYTTTYLSTYYCICPHTTVYKQCPVRRRSLLYPTTTAVRILLHLSSHYCIHAVSTLSAKPYCYICPHPTTYLSSYYCTHTHTHTSHTHTHTHTHTQSPIARRHSLPCPTPTSLNQPKGRIQGTRTQVSIFFFKSH
jgi:hypothetical protein